MIVVSPWLSELSRLASVDTRRLARDERADLAAFLTTLSPEQWQAPTLCAHWRVRDVVAHVISYDELHMRSLLAKAVRGRFWSRRVNALAMAPYSARSPEQLLALLTAHLQPRGLPAALGGRVALTEGLIHHQDIRRALAAPRAIPPERLLPALRVALIAPDIGGLWRIRGLGKDRAGAAWKTCPPAHVRQAPATCRQPVSASHRRPRIRRLEGHAARALARRV